MSETRSGGSAANFVETALVIDASRDPIASRRFDELVKEPQITIEPMSEAQARVAREAYCEFGRGSRHPRTLMFRDCFAYALAKTTGEPLLSKGADFIHTDIVPELARPVTAKFFGHRVRPNIVLPRTRVALAAAGPSKSVRPTPCPMITRKIWIVGRWKR